MVCEDDEDDGDEDDEDEDEDERNEDDTEDTEDEDKILGAYHISYTTSKKASRQPKRRSSSDDSDMDEMKILEECMKKSSVEDTASSSEFRGIFVIGDIHFRSKHFIEGKEFSEKCLEKIAETRPSCIVLLGDVLDTHEVARNEPFNQACSFIKLCSEYAPTYVLVGNHDYINNSQYLTDNHFFNPLKHYQNVTIVDTPLRVNVNSDDDESVAVWCLMCPYVPNGMFIKSIVETYGSGWFNDVDLVFAHQEIKGVKMRRDAKSNVLLETSVKGDSYGGMYPPLISGHIHHPQTLGTNVFYPGSAMQINFDEDPEKRVWLVKFTPTKQLDIEKFDLQLKGLKEIHLPLGDIEKFSEEETEKFYIKLVLSAPPEAFGVFKKSQKYLRLRSKGVRMSFVPLTTSRTIDASRKHLASFREIFKELVSKRSKDVQTEYENIMGEDAEDVYEEEEEEVHHDGDVELIFNDEDTEMEED
jgi:DNA repair exonuclease SbcCD nuclease subunit